MYLGPRSTWLPIVLAVAVATSLPAVADEVAESVRDDDVLLVGDPSGQADVHVEQSALGQDVDAGTAKTYDVPVEPPTNRLEIELRYDTGPIATTGPCLKANDLDLFVDGPGFERVYNGCDTGHVTVLADDVPTGNYTVRVEAKQGSTACVPNEFSRCDSPGVEYRLDVTVWDVET